MTPIKDKIVNLNLHNDNDRVLDFSDFQKNDIIEVYNSKITERRIWEAKNQVDP